MFDAYLAVFVLLCYLRVKLLGLGWLLAYLHASTCVPSSAYHKWYHLKEWDFNPFLNFQLLETEINKEGVWFILVCVTEKWWQDAAHALYEAVKGGQLEQMFPLRIIAMHSGNTKYISFISGSGLCLSSWFWLILSWGSDLQSSEQSGHCVELKLPNAEVKKIEVSADSWLTIMHVFPVFMYSV